MKRTKSQLNAISYSYAKQNEQKANELKEKCKKLGISFKEYKSNVYQISECLKRLNENKKDG